MYKPETCRAECTQINTQLHQVGKLIHFFCEELILEVRLRILHTPSLESSGGIVGE